MFPINEIIKGFKLSRWNIKKENIESLFILRRHLSIHYSRHKEEVRRVGAAVESNINNEDRNLVTPHRDLFFVHLLLFISLKLLIQASA